MSTPDLDLSRAFDDLFDGEPDGPPVAHHVARGRRYVVRRRAAAALAAAGVVAVIGTGFAIVDRGPDSDAGLPPAGQQSDPATPDPTIQTDHDFPEGDLDVARIEGYVVDYRGELIIGEGVHVIERVDLPEGAGHADRSYGLHIVRQGAERWIYAPWNAPADDLEGGPMSRSVKPVVGLTFREWLDGVVAEQTPQEPIDPNRAAQLEQIEEAMGALDVDSYGRVTLSPDAVIVQRVDNPLGLRAPYESAGLRVDYRGVESWWLTTPRGASPTAVDSDLTFERWLQKSVEEGPVIFGSGPTPPLVKINQHAMPEPRPDVEVIRRVDNPLEVSAPARSVAYWARLRDGSEWWYLWERGPSGHLASEVTRAAGDGYRSFDGWLADQSPQAPW